MKSHLPNDMEPQMHADERRERLNQISEKIIGCTFTVGNILGSGFLEKAYENALTHELKCNGLNAVQQWPIQVKYKGIVVGDYVADILVENSVIVELKVCKAFDEVHSAQCLNYLKATGMPLCL